jgi:hypothetical protein
MRHFIDELSFIVRLDGNRRRLVGGNDRFATQELLDRI